MRKAVLVYTPRLLSYRLSAWHPLKPERLQATFELIEACGLLDGERIVCQEPVEASREELLSAHDSAYLAAVEALSSGGDVNPLPFGLGTSDNPVFPGMYEASALCAGGSALAAELVASGEAEASFNIGGGLHHAHRGRAAGFCVFNDPVVAIAHLLRKCGEGVRVAYVDVDAHHGDGVQEAFYPQRQVLTISLHESTEFLFPWREGEPEDLGEGEGRGYSVNLPLAPYTDDETFLWAFEEVVLPLLSAFGPDFVVAQLGCDGHLLDPLTHLAYTTHGFDRAFARLCSPPAGKLIALGGGGYDLEVVPRVWTLALARMAGVEPPERIPEALASRYPHSRGFLHDPERLTLGQRERERVRAFASASVDKVKRLVFPYHGL